MNKQWWIQDLQSGCTNLFFAENCMKIKELDPLGHPWRPPWIRQRVKCNKSLEEGWEFSGEGARAHLQAIKNIPG